MAIATYRVINPGKQEIVAELGDVDLAFKMADRLAEDSHWREQFVVVELVTIYQTPLKKDEPE